jgi:NDP-mannose synthase
MHAIALVMAGGLGERMRRSLHGEEANVPKPLLPVRGVPLLERCLLAVLRARVREIVVTTPALLPEVAQFVRSRGRDLARAAGASLVVWEEAAPLGTIGAAAGLRGQAEAVLVVNADNLTALRLDGLLDDHESRRPAMSIAAHKQTLVIPFGSVVAEEGRITRYLEKPAFEVPISSGTYVLGPAALDALAPERRASVPRLVERLLAIGAEVRAYGHAAPWVDVNDAAALARAEALVAANLDDFERWPEAPDVEVVGAVLHGPEGVLLEWRPATASAYPGQWDTPGGKIEPGEAPADALSRELREELGLEVPSARLATVFDDLDVASGRVFRHHVFAADVTGQRPHPRLRQELRWLSPHGTTELALESPVVRRSLAAAGGLP